VKKLLPSIRETFKNNLRTVGRAREKISSFLNEIALEPEQEPIGLLFQTARVVAQISIREAAERIGIEQTLLDEYENGTRVPREWRPLFEKLTPRIRTEFLPRVSTNKLAIVTDVAPKNDANYFIAYFIRRLGGVVIIDETELMAIVKEDPTIQRFNGNGQITFSLPFNNKVSLPEAPQTRPTQFETPQSKPTEYAGNDNTHDPSDPLDFARQWMYRALNRYTTQTGKFVTVAGSDGKPEHAFLDEFLPALLAPALSAVTPADIFINEWLKRARHRSGETMKKWRQRVGYDLRLMFQSAQLEERTMIVEFLKGHAEGYRHGGDDTRARTLEKKIDQIKLGRHREITSESASPRGDDLENS